MRSMFFLNTRYHCCCQYLLVVNCVVVVAIVDSHTQRTVLATEETTVTQQVSHRPIKCQSRSWSQRGTKVNGSHHGDSPLLKPTGIQIATTPLPGPANREHLNDTVLKDAWSHAARLYILVVVIRNIIPIIVVLVSVTFTLLFLPRRFT